MPSMTKWPFLFYRIMIFTKFFIRLFSGFHREVHENCSSLGYHSASSGNFLPMFWDILDSWPLKTGPILCPETSIRNCHYSLRNNPEERSSQVFHITPLPSSFSWVITSRTDDVGYSHPRNYLAVEIKSRDLVLACKLRNLFMVKYEKGQVPKTVS